MCTNLSHLNLRTYQLHLYFKETYKYLQVPCDSERINLKQDPDSITTMSEANTAALQSALDGKEAESCSLNYDKTDCQTDSKLDIFTTDSSDHKSGQMSDEIQCSVCEAQYDNITEYTHHLNMHLQEQSGYINTLNFPDLHTASQISPLKDDESEIGNINTLNFPADLQTSQFPTPKDDKSEIGAVPQDTKYFSCTLCDKSFASKQYLSIHINAIHLKLKPFSCTLCDKSFSQKGKLNEHVAGVHEKSFCCTLCDKSFTQKTSLTAHVEAKHKESSHQESKIFACTMCDKIYSVKNSLNRHIHTFHGTVKYSCTFCQKSFTRKGDLTRHIDNIHHKIKRFSCTLCDKMFSFKKDVVRHANAVHHKLKPFSCTLCDRSFTCERNLNKHHNIVHRKLKPFSCTLCDKSFSCKANLSAHIGTVHDKTREISCTKCNRTFFRKGQLAVHVSLVHRKLNSFCCKFCDSSFSSRRNLTLHKKFCIGISTEKYSEHFDQYKVKTEPQPENDELKTEFSSHVDDNNRCREQDITQQVPEKPCVIFKAGKIKEYKIKTEPQTQDIKIKEEFPVDPQMDDYDKCSTEQQDLVEEGDSEISTKEVKYKILCSIYNERFEVMSDYTQHFQMHLRNLNEHKDNGSHHIKSDFIIIKEDGSHYKPKLLAHPSCKKCGKPFSTTQHLNKHINAVHRKLKPFSCASCNRPFAHKETLWRHVRAVHRKMKPFVCSYKSCEKSFALKGQLIVHINAKHHKIKLYSCTLCDKSFAEKAKLRKHTDAVHHKLKSFSCTLCDKSFAQNVNLIGHMNAVHRKIKNFPCTLCEKSFSYKSDLARHLLSHDKRKCFTCYVCDKSYTLKTHLSRHLKSHMGSRLILTGEDKKGADQDYKPKTEFPPLQPEDESAFPFKTLPTFIRKMSINQSSSRKGVRDRKYYPCSSSADHKNRRKGQYAMLLH